MSAYPGKFFIFSADEVAASSVEPIAAIQAVYFIALALNVGTGRISCCNHGL
jgi:hypothetical protein